MGTFLLYTRSGERSPGLRPLVQGRGQVAANTSATYFQRDNSHHFQHLADIPFITARSVLRTLSSFR